ncbi:Hypothetical predicted protein, partial [Pelobates cultripes]
LTLYFWDEIGKREGKEGTLLEDAPISCIAAGIPIFDTKKWNEAGCTKLRHLYHEGNLLAFPDLQARHNIPNKALFSYLQLKSLLTGVQINSQATHNKRSIEQFCLTNKPPKKTISTIYNILTGDEAHPDITFQTAWHKELGQTIDKEQWHRAFTIH